MERPRLGGAFASAAPAFGGGTTGRQSGHIGGHSTRYTLELHSHDPHLL